MKYALIIQDENGKTIIEHVRNDYDDTISMILPQFNHEVAVSEETLVSLIEKHRPDWKVFRTQFEIKAIPLADKISFDTVATPNIFTEVSKWHDDLMWCPSQCEKRIEYKGRYFLIYLRWRHCDPWEASLIECGSNGKSYDFDKWHPLNIKPWRDCELIQLKQEAEELVNKWLKQNIK